MRLIVAVLGVLLVPSGIHVINASNPRGECTPYCVRPQLPRDKICNFNSGDPCGVVSGNVSFCPGACQEGLCIQGAGYVTVGDDDQYSHNALEIEFQVILDRVPQPDEHASGLVTKYRGASPPESEWGVFVEKEGTWLLVGDGTNFVSSGPGMVNTGVSYRVRVVLLGSHGELWIDEQLVASGPISRNPSSTATPVIIGNSFQPGHDNAFFGVIDEVRIGVHGSLVRRISCQLER